MFEVKQISNEQEGSVRRASFQTCDAVCSRQIDIELDGDVIARLEGINCKGRGTSCPDQLSRALKML